MAATYGTQATAQTVPSPPSDSQTLLYRSALAVAENPCELNEIEDTALVGELPAELRGWEWDYFILSDECFAALRLPAH
jgi:hypothetical protein